MRKRGILLRLIVLLVGAFFLFDLGRLLSLEYLQSQREEMAAYFQANPLPMVLGYFLIYVAVTGLSLPGAVVLTLAGGAIFGVVWGMVIISFASTAGATMAFLLPIWLLVAANIYFGVDTRLSVQVALSASQIMFGIAP